MLRMVLALGLVCAVSGPVSAQQAVEGKIAALEKRVEALEKKAGEQERCIAEQKCCIAQQKETIASYESKMERFDRDLNRQLSGQALLADGLRIGAGATMIVQGTGNTNATEQKKESRSDASYSADITLEKEFAELQSRAFIHLESGQGAGIEDELALYSNVNNDADNNNNVRLTEFWYEQKLAGDRMAVSFGKLDPTVYFDNNEAANDETVQFLGRMFVNNPAVEFPDRTAGIRLAFAPVDMVELEYGVFDADADFEKIGDNLFNIGQVNFKSDVAGRTGNYRFFIWNNKAPHTKWRDADSAKAAAYGWGLSFDQKVSDELLLFTRYGWQNPKVYNPALTATGDRQFSLEHSWSAGAQVAGSWWGRQKDVVGIAIGQVIPSAYYRKADESRRAKTEGHLEAYYNIRVNDHFSISPDFHYITNPFGKDIVDDTSPVCVYGVRSQVDF